MRTIPAPELALWREGGAREYRVRVKRPEEAAWTNLSATMGGDWVVGIRADIPTPDQVAGAFDIRFLRSATDTGGFASLSPGLSAEPVNIDAALAYRPFLHPRRYVEVDVRVNAEPWRLWLQGRIEDVEWPGDEVLVKCLTLDGVLLATQIETEEESGAANPGTPVETEIQNLLNQWMASPPTLLVEGTPDFGVGPYRPAVGSLGEQIRALAQRMGWDVRYKWSEADSDFRLTLYLPPRDKVTPDYLLPLDEVFEIPGLRQSAQWIRNAIRVPYIDSTTGLDAEEVVIDQDSIDEYGRMAMTVPLSENNDIPGTQAQAQALGGYGISDLSTPPIDGRYRIPFMPWLELHDLLAIEADGARFDTDRNFAVVGGSHEVTPDGGSWTELDLRGGAPSGGTFAWHRFHGAFAGILPEDYALQDVRFADETTGRRYYWTNGAAIKEIWAATATIAGDVTDADWVALEAAVTLQGLITEYLVPWPGEDNRTIGRIEGRWTDTAGNSRADRTFVLKIDVPGTRPPISVEVTVAENAAGTEATITATVSDPRGVVSSVNLWVLQNGVETGPTAMSDNGGGVFGRVVTLLPKPHITSVRGELVRNDGGDPIPFVVPPIDSDKAANVLDAQAAPDGTGNATITAVFDSDTAVGVGEAEYRIDGGAAVAVTVAADRTATWSLAQTAAEQLVEIRGYNAASAAGDWFPLRVPPDNSPTTIPKIISLTAARQSPGNCGLGTHLTNRVTIELQGTQTGDLWDLLRYEDGVETLLVDNDIPVATLQVDDVLTGYEETSLGAPVAVVYRAYLTPAAGGLDSKDSPPLTQEWTACP